MAEKTYLVQNWNLAGIVDKLMAVEVYAVGRCSDPAALGACEAWKLLAQLYVDGAGAVSVAGQQELSSFKDSPLKHDTYSFNVSGSVVSLNITSKNGYDMQLSCTHQELLV